MLITVFALSACDLQHSTTPTGTFRGVLPCADCPGINYKLTLNEDMSYTENVMYLGKSTTAKTRSGKFEVKNENIVWLKDKSKKEGMNHFTLDSGGLTMLDINGNPIRSGFSEQYHLIRE
ncbi:MAG: copper resistance protein NlpE [Cyclobacteriaceae bacterium]